MGRVRALLTRTFDIVEIFPLAPASGRDPYTAHGGDACGRGRGGRITNHLRTTNYPTTN
ncbi:MAG TPA: hypothetical protein VFO21_04640 [Vicinamibacterales bacterium]|nr:hypothetical protein [Vicinamibacterales bacterium]